MKANITPFKMTAITIWHYKLSAYHGTEFKLQQYISMSHEKGL